MLERRPDPTRVRVAHLYRIGTPIDVITTECRVHTRVVYSVVREFDLPRRGQGGPGLRHDRRVAPLDAQVGLGPIVSGDPNIIGEHEVPAVACPHCRLPLPWALIKGWG